MAKRTWRDTKKGHHWVDRPTRESIPLWEAMFDDYTTPMSGEEHVQAHRDAKYGVFGAMTLFELRRLNKEE